MTLPKVYEIEFKKFSSQPKIDLKMQAKKEFLLDFPAFFGEAVTELREEGREEGIEKERESNILKLNKHLGLTAVQIANTLQLSVEYVQSIIDKNVE